MKILKIFTVLVFCIFALQSKAGAFAPHLYGVVSYVNKNVENNTDNTPVGIQSFNPGIGLDFSGLYPLPIISNLRLQLDAMGLLANKQKLNTQYALNIYYDIRLVPLLNPYIGLGFVSDDVSSVFKDMSHIFQRTTTLNAGLNLDLPILHQRFSIFIEYRYKINKNYNAQQAVIDKAFGKDRNTNKFLNSNTVLFGVRIKIL